jgi:putative SOS response-associated peptidase YedK
MCGRFTLTVDPADLREAFGNYAFPAKFAPRFNIAPTQPILAIPNDATPALPLRSASGTVVAGGARENKADFFVWGLIPAWAKDPSMGSRLINARAETLAEKPSFRGAFKYKRCLILADGFYEWKSQPGTKTKVPHFIFLKNREPFAFAGLWDEWHSPDGGTLRSATIITTAPNELMATIHDRMPVILHPSDYAQWLDTSPRAPESLQPLLKAFPVDEMSAYPVSMLVNSPANDRAELVVPT